MIIILRILNTETGSYDINVQWKILDQLGTIYAIIKVLIGLLSFEGMIIARESMAYPKNRKPSMHKPVKRMAGSNQDHR